MCTILHKWNENMRTLFFIITTNSEIDYHNVGSLLLSIESYGISSCENRGNKTWMPPIELSVLCIEWVITAFTSCNRNVILKIIFNQLLDMYYYLYSSIYYELKLNDFITWSQNFLLNILLRHDSMLFVYTHLKELPHTASFYLTSNEHLLRKYNYYQNLYYFYMQVCAYLYACVREKYTLF